MIEILKSIWAAIDHTVIYLGALSILSLFATKIPGKLGEWAQMVVDFLSANLAHKTKTPPK